MTASTTTTTTMVVAGFLETGSRVWIPHKSNAFCCVEVIIADNARLPTTTPEQHLAVVYVDETTGSIVERGAAAINVPRSDVLGRVEDNWQTPLDDLVNLTELSEPALLHQLKQRYRRDLIYARTPSPLGCRNSSSSLIEQQQAQGTCTRGLIVCTFSLSSPSRGGVQTSVGPILVSVNPYKPLSNHHGDLERHLTRTHDQAGGAGSSPHMYGVAAAAYQRLLTQGTDQSVLIRYFCCSVRPLAMFPHTSV
jgi:myosin heavy subunit